MLRTLFACIPATMLAACGGDGTPPPAPPVATAPDATWTSRCGQSPQPAADAHYLGVTPDGAFGTWTFDTQALVSHYTVTDGLGITTHGTSTLHRDAATCSYIAEGTGALRTAFLANGLAVSSAQGASAAVPAMLVTQPQASPAAVAGRYDLVRYMRVVQPSGTLVLAGYGTFTIDAQGAWSLCLDSAPGASCTPEIGSSAVRSDGSFDIVMSGQVHAHMVVKDSGAAKLLLMAVANPFDPAQQISGMWIGRGEEASSVATGRYVVGDVGGATHVDALSAAGLAVDGAPAVATTGDSPLPGYFALAGGTGIGFTSALGVIAIASPASANPGSIAFGVASSAP